MEYMYDVGCFIKPKDGFEIIKDDVLTKYSPEVYDGCFVLYCSPSKSNLAVVMFHELGALSLMVVDLNDFEIIKDVSSFMCNSNNKNSIYSYKPCLGSMIQSLFYVRIVPFCPAELSRTQPYQPAKLSGYDVEDKYNAPVFALSDIGWFYIASKSSNKDELLHNVESRLRKSNPKFNVYFGERLKNFELLYKYEWVFNDRFSFSML